jgi:hypothetical protein
MIEEVTAPYQKRQGAEFVVKIFEFCLPLSAVIVAFYICLLSKVPIPIERPAVLALASFCVLLPLKSKSLRTLQKLTAFYLVSVPVNELALQYSRTSLLSVNISLSYTTVILSLCAMGYVVGKLNPANTLRGAGRTNILYGWVLAFGIIIIHMVLLTFILNEFYGYGYERNLSVLGNLCLYFLLFILLWAKLDQIRFRQAAGLIVAIFYMAVIVAGK